MKKRRALSLLLAAALTLGVMPVSRVSAEDLILDETAESSVMDGDMDNGTNDAEEEGETEHVEAFETDAVQEVTEDNDENTDIANSSELDGVDTDDFVCDIQTVDGNEITQYQAGISQGTYGNSTTNVITYNENYAFSELCSERGYNYPDRRYYLDLTVPEDGRMKILTTDCKSANMSPRWYFSINDVSSVSMYGYAKWNIEDMDTGWVTVNAGRVIFSLEGQPDKEAKVMVQYQTLKEYTGEIETNNTFDTANIIETNVTYEGNYNKYKDVDYFKFTMQNPGLAEINVTVAPYVLYEEDSNGNVYEVIKGNQYSKDSQKRLRLGKGNYFLVITPSESSDKREYTLCVNATYESAEDYEQESNNVKSLANEKKTNHTYTGNLNTKEDVDCFKMTVSEPSFLALEFRVPRQTDKNMLKIRLYDGNMEKVLEEATNTENPYLKTEEILCPAGTYYVRAEAGWNYSSYFSDDYSFNLNQRPYKYVTSLSLPATKTATEGTTFTLTPTINPSDAENKTLSWSSSNPYVATVDANGKVTAKAAGTTNITVTATDRNSVTAVCTLTVQKRVIKYVTGISLPTNIRVENYETFSLAPVITPNDAENKALKWHSSNLDVAEVDQNGNVETFGCGTARITVTAKDRNIVYASCLVTVYRKVEYKLNGGTNNSQNPTTYSGGTISLKNPSRKGYIFKGWYSDKKYKRKVTQITASNIYYMTFHAKWEKVKVNKASLSSVKAKSGKKAAVKYKAVSKASGYEVVYSTDKKMKKNCISLKTKSKSVTLSGLTKGKTYYVKVRAYKTDSAGQAVYGKYSSVKKVKIKK